MLQRGGVYPMLGPRRVLDLFAAYYDDPVPPGELLELVGLRGVAGTPWRHLSGGEQQRLSLALALIGRPAVAFLDEPTAGVDPEGRLAIRAVVADLKDDGHVRDRDHPRAGRGRGDGRPDRDPRRGPGRAGGHARRAGETRHGQRAPTTHLRSHSRARHRRPRRGGRPGHRRGRDVAGALPGRGRAAPPVRRARRPSPPGWPGWV